MCTKRRFATRPAALLRIAEIKRKGEVRDKQPIREYFCKGCGGYHLTSQPMSADKKKIIQKRKEAMPERIAEHYIQKYHW